MLVESALTCLQSRDKVAKGGVMTPTAAFIDTDLIERLRRAGIAFEVVKD